MERPGPANDAMSSPSRPWTMDSPLNILLLTNYREDRQRSMLRFGKLLASNLFKNGIELSEVFPKSNIRRFCFGSKLRKWAGYLDKYYLFEKKLDSLFKDKSFDLIHIVDHSNSIYLPKLSRLTKVPKVTTCHDMIAILSAWGEFPLAPITSRTGQRLQKWIALLLSLNSQFRILLCNLIIYLMIISPS